MRGLHGTPCCAGDPAFHDSVHAVYLDGMHPADIGQLCQDSLNASIIMAGPWQMSLLRCTS